MKNNNEFFSELEKINQYSNLGIFLFIIKNKINELYSNNTKRKKD